MQRRFFVAWICGSILCPFVPLEAAQEASGPSRPASSDSEKPITPPFGIPGDEVPDEWKKLSPQHPVWIDRQHGRVIMDGEVCLRQGQLEMFACPKNTKEHESIVAADTEAYLVHAALLALGAKAGQPVQFRPEFRPPTGTQVDVVVSWREKDQPRLARAQEWIRDLKTQKPMDQKFVFAGSGFWTDPQTGKRYYQAEGGDFICVANFTSALLDVAGQSDATNDALLFEAFTDRIPKEGTPVRLALIPHIEGPRDRGAKTR